MSASNAGLSVAPLTDRALSVASVSASASTSSLEKPTVARVKSAAVPLDVIVPPFSASAFSGTWIPSVSSLPAATS